MNRAVQELKTRARLLINASRSAEGALAGGHELRLRDCLQAVSREAGFAHWDHARWVLGGQARIGEDHGTFWYAPGCAGLLTPWFAHYSEAREARLQNPEAVLLPYKRQYLLASPDFISEIGLEADSPLWAEAGFDLVRSAGSPSWEALAYQRLRAVRARPVVPAVQQPGPP